MKEFYLFKENNEPISFYELMAYKIPMRNLNTLVSHTYHEGLRFLIYYRIIPENQICEWLKDIPHRKGEEVIYCNERFENVIYIQKEQL